MAVATKADVMVSLRRDFRGNEEKWIDALLDRAETKVRIRIRDLDERVADPVFFDALVQVEAEAVARVLRADNAGIYSSEAEDGYSYQLNFKVASGLLDILPEDWEDLGVGGLRTVAQEYDTYAASRYGTARPDLAFQYQFGAPEFFSTDIGD